VAQEIIDYADLAMYCVKGLGQSKRVTSMQDLIAETPADDIEGVGIKLALYVYMRSVNPDTTGSAAEQVLSAYKDCVRVLGRDFLAEERASLYPLPQRSNAGGTLRRQPM
jgi:hypothetical protein